MDASLIKTVFLPIALGIVMLGMGLSLTVQDFKNILKSPKAICVGLSNQLLLLPILGFLIAYAFKMSPEYQVGIMVLAACPGGVTSNLISHLAKGDTALSVSLTALNSFISIFTIPLIISWSIAHFMGQSESINVAGTILGQVAALTLIPVSLGMWIRKSKTSFAVRMERPVKIASAVILAVVIVGAILNEKDTLGASFSMAGPSTLALNISTMLLGFLSAKLFRLNLAQQVTIAIESGIQNGTLALFITLATLGNNAMSIPPAIYSLIMFGTGFIMIMAFGKRS
ncbi:MAG: bile acid:sodium symporter family protein [Luteibaculum sp.]